MISKTKANVPPPKTLKQRLVAAPPATMSVPDNLSKPTEGIVDLNFKVPESFHRKFKITAATRGMSMKDLLEAAFASWEKEFVTEDKPFTTQTDIFRG